MVFSSKMPVIYNLPSHITKCTHVKYYVIRGRYSTHCHCGHWPLSIDFELMHQSEIRFWVILFRVGASGRLYVIWVLWPHTRTVCGGASQAIKKLFSGRMLLQSSVSDSTINKYYAIVWRFVLYGTRIALQYCYLFCL